MPLPLVKIGYLALRSFSKPVAKSLKVFLSTHPISATYIAELGQFSHRFWAQVTIRAAGHKGLRIKPLEHDIALSQGADAFSELFVFSVAGLCIVTEVVRNDMHKKHDEEVERAKIEEQENQLKDMLTKVEERLTSMETSQSKLKELLTGPSMF